ncbi:hypothetical protein [Colwellia sp. Bg11-28]|uniref:hypothetical protein n=1 Tax=Colwellia sp. Bg11-28 TaxID=2058305 RepID=UPI000C33B92B|nr:hypothetical protein [Colwellia sp. Bg11-28]PKH86907.1 hypothetical protein CXF79_09245 [Colwellia sp. Bg11-28]
MDKVKNVIPQEKKLREIIKDILNFSSEDHKKKDVVNRISQQLEMQVPLAKDLKQKLNKRAQNVLNDLVKNNEISSIKIRPNLRIYMAKTNESDLIKYQSRLKLLSEEKEELNIENNGINETIELRECLNARLTRFKNDKELIEDLKIEIMSLDKDIKQGHHKINSLKITIQLIKTRLEQTRNI